MFNNISVKKLEKFITFNLFLILFSGLGFSSSILTSVPEVKFVDKSNPKVLGLTIDKKCIDSDALSLNKSIYIKGEVTFIKEPNNTIVHKDHCTNDNKFLVEEFCEFNKTSGETSVKSIVYTCENKCNDGACVVKQPSE